jgi:hypothetical protein
VGALSIATDRETGQPLEHAMRTAVLAVRLGELAGVGAEELADTHYVALLHASGCTSNGHEAAQLFGDNIVHRAAFYLVDPTNPAEVHRPGTRRRAQDRRESWGRRSRRADRRAGSLRSGVSRSQAFPFTL